MDIERLLALIGTAGCLGITLNTCIMLILAGFHKKKITLEFNRYHEYWFELFLCFAMLALGTVSILWILHN